MLLVGLLYADPGSGALVWQLLLGSLVGLSFYFRKWWAVLIGEKKERSSEASSEGNRHK